MDGELNATYLTFDGYVEVHRYRYLYFVAVLTTYILVIYCNTTIVYLIWTHQNLHEPMYIFIAALSVNSVLFSTVIYPKLLIDFLSEKQIISYPACLFQFHMYYSLGGSDFLLLAVMAYDRYVSICKPLQYATIMRKTTVIICLAFAWFVPLCHVVFGFVLVGKRKICNFTLKGIFCNNTVHLVFCGSSKATFAYGVVVLFNVALVPVLFILFTYTRILIISHRSSRDVRRKAAQTCLPHLVVLMSFSCLCAYDVIIALLEFNISKTVHMIMTLQVVLYNPLFNPIIYGLKMKEIFKQLKRLFCSGKQQCQTLTNENRFNIDRHR